MIVNDNGINREMTADEIAGYEQAAAQIAADRERAEAETTAALETRKAPLRRLGLTEDEINVVLGL
jgi:hypothetical protein